MIICPTCNAENESHYKFCLGCGAELNASMANAPETDDVSTPTPEEKQEASPLKHKLEAMRQRKLSESPGLIPSVAPDPKPPEPEEASFESVHTMHDQDATNVEHLPSVMEEDRFQSENGGLYGIAAESAGPPPGHSTDAQGLGGLDTVRLSTEVKSTPTDIPKQKSAEVAATPSQTAGVISCAQCGAEVTPGFRFCGTCGAPIETETTASAEPQAASLGELVFIHPNGDEGERLPIRSTDIILGRDSEFGILQSDPHLSPKHARLVFQDDTLYCEDLDSFNGVFTRLMDETVLEHGGMFRIGQQLFLFEEQSARSPDYVPDNMSAIPFGSPIGSVWGRLSSVCGPEVFADQWILKTPEIYLGREKGTLTFPDDVFVSGTHCRLKNRDRVCLIEDLGSTNGTYIKREGRFRLRSQDFILLGQQLFRVELKSV